MRVAGMDVWKRGWVTVFVDGGTIDAIETFATLADFHAVADDVVAVGLDIPVVLPSDPPRRADADARAAIGPRRSSVFNAPPLDVIEQPTYPRALALSRERHGIGVSAQSYALRTRILEAQAIAHTDDRFFEVHPEVSFAAMAGHPLAFAKKTWNGQTMRRDLLAAHGLEIPSTIDGAAGSIPADDVLDAAAAAWSANRRASGLAGTLPSDPAPGEGVIWY